MIEPLFVSLTKATHDTCLTKQIPVEMTRQPTTTILEYMINPAADNLNPNYSVADQRLLDIISDIYKRRDAVRMEVAFLSAKDNMPHKIDLSAPVSKYEPDGIYHTVNSALSGTQPYSEIRLVCDQQTNGGL